MLEEVGCDTTIATVGRRRSGKRARLRPTGGEHRAACGDDARIALLPLVALAPIHVYGIVAFVGFDLHRV